MKLSDRLLAALELDEMDHGYANPDYKYFYPNLMRFYNELVRLENGPTMLNYDRWGIERPLGLHSLREKEE